MRKLLICLSFTDHKNVNWCNYENYIIAKSELNQSFIVM